MTPTHPCSPRAARRQSGIALIMVLMVVTVLAVLAGGFAYALVWVYESFMWRRHHGS